MKGFVMILALYLGGLGPSFAIAAQEAVGVPPHDEQAAFDYACKLLDYDCSNVEPPKIVWDNLYITRGLLGGYVGDNVILMDSSVLRWADEVFIQSILAHETAHYLDVQLGVIQLPFTYDNVCQSEMRAWRVGNAYVVSHGRPDFADFTWAERYGCFQSPATYTAPDVVPVKE